jgi:hypothetical protein
MPVWTVGEKFLGLENHMIMIIAEEGKQLAVLCFFMAAL